ncbi:MAG TPA: Hsp20/alpha crystallin family protein [Solirubrobacteraceae bacterium]|nr:Hsp20/alpha crystallin family protein [Solirubrobacteraceae bacterium]
MLTLDLPGLTAEDLSIEVHNDALTVRGERRRPEVGEGVTYLYARRPYGTFEHRVELPKGVDPEAITASMENGVLSLIIPKPEPLKPKRIAIGAPSEDRQLESAAV